MSREQEFLNAAKTGDQETFLNILNDQSTNIDPNHTDIRGYTALMWAAKHGHSEIVSELLADVRVDPSHADEDGGTALIIAAEYGHSDIVRALLADQRVDPNHADDFSITALLGAAWAGHTAIVNMLLADGRVDPTITDKYGNTALIDAACWGHINIVRTLLADDRIDPNLANEGGNTALIQAAFHGHSDIVSALIDDPRIDLSHADQAKKAMIEASRRQEENTLRILLRYSDQRPNPHELATLSNEAQDLYRSTLLRTKARLRARFRGIVRLMIYFRRMRLRAAEAVYAPGGTGFDVAAKHFYSAVASHQLSSNSTLRGTETDNTTAGITLNSSEPGEPATKKQRT